MKKILAILCLLSVLSACSESPSERHMPFEHKTWGVYKNSAKVLIVSDTPGPLISTANSPAKMVPPKHPFLSATALEPTEENALKEILDKSGSFEDFLSKLRERGYAVVQE